jgi:NAD+ kinase
MSSDRLGPIARVGLVAKANLRAATSHLADIIDWLQTRHIEVVVESDTAKLLSAMPTAAVMSKQAMAARVDMVLVLGGDGTLLSMADAIGEAGSGIPILGVNFGSLGFLTEITLPELYPSLETALHGAAHVESRMMLSSTTFRQGRTLAQLIALNDAVVTKGPRSRMIDLTVFVGDELVTRVKADGLIIATPTGSTAYNLAAGGPIVKPDLDALVLTPIAPHTLTNRPIVIPATARIRVHPNIEERDELFATFDGQASFQLQAGDELTVERAPTPLRLIRPSTRSYFEVLRAKLKWGTVVGSQ